MRIFYGGIILEYWKAYDSLSKHQNNTSKLVKYKSSTRMNKDEIDEFVQVQHDFSEIAKEAANDQFITKDIY